MKKVICLLLMVSILFAGCAGREANPVAMYIPGDENRECKSLLIEMSQIQQEMDVLRPKTNKFATNAAWGVAGFFLIVPLFFMDLKEAEKIEYDAYARRYNRLLIYASEKDCDLINLPTEPELTVEQKIKQEKAKKAAEEAKASTPEVKR